MASCTDTYKPDIANKTVIMSRSVILGLWHPLAFINSRDRPPILTVHRAVDNESDTKPLRIEVFHLENSMTVEQIPHLSPGQQCRKIAGCQFMVIQHRNPLGPPSPDGMRIASHHRP